MQSAKSDEPFHLQLKKHFAQHKKFGSRDRKIISKLCYYFFRTAHLFSRKINEENLYASIFLCENISSPLLAFLSPTLNDSIHLPIVDKLKLLQLEAKNIFPFADLLSAEIDAAKFAESFLLQPHLYLRSRPGKQNTVIAALQENNIEMTVEGDCLQLKNAVDLNDVKGLNRNFVIQDKQSQKVFKNLPDANITTVWDCCAASGGKSILLVDTIQQKIQLSITDIRKNILENAKARLATAGIAIYNADVRDLTKEDDKENANSFDLVICDVPCTGSGTWSRTPEQLYFFKRNQVSFYTNRQVQIATSASKHLNKNGLLVYITCSVFDEENEAVITQLCKADLILESKQYYKGYTEQADTLFVAVLRKM